MIKPFRLLRAWGVGSWLLILMSAGFTMRRRLFRGFIVRSKNFSRCLSGGLRASSGANAPFTWLRSPSHSELFEVHSDSPDVVSLVLPFNASILIRLAGLVAGRYKHEAG